MAGPSPLITRLARKYGRRYGVRPSVLLGLMEVESGFNPNAVSSAGARGLTQFMPGTAAGYGVKYGDSRKAIKSQIRGAANYLDDLGWDDNRRLALASYNAGPGNPGAAGDYPELVLAAAKNYKGLGGVGKSPAGSGSRAPGDLPDFGTKGFRAPQGPNIFSILGSFQPNLGEGFEETEASVNQGYKLLAQMLNQQQAEARLTELNLPEDSQGMKGVEGKRARGIKPGGGYNGTQNIALGLAKGLGTITSEKRDTKYTSSGNISDHWVGNKNAYAVDIAASGKAGNRMIRTLAKRLGVPPSTLIGTYDPINFKGFRVQVLWKVPGHYDHVHIGVSVG